MCSRCIEVGAEEQEGKGRGACGAGVGLEKLNPPTQPQPCYSVHGHRCLLKAHTPRRNHPHPYPSPLGAGLGDDIR